VNALGATAIDGRLLGLSQSDWMEVDKEIRNPFVIASCDSIIRAAGIQHGDIMS